MEVVILLVVTLITFRLYRWYRDLMEEVKRYDTVLEERMQECSDTLNLQ